MARLTGIRLIGGLVMALALLLAISSTAAASGGASNRVRSELRQADEALDAVWLEAESDEGEGDEADEDEDAWFTYDLDAVAANLAHTEAARRQAMKLRRSRATMLAAVNDQADANVYEYADDATFAPVEQEPALAAALATSVSVRSSVTAAMLVKAEKLKPRARAAVLRSIVDALSDGDPDTLLEALAEEDGAGDATKAGLAGSLARILADSRATLGTLGRLAAKLDRAERDKVVRASGEIAGSLDELPAWVDELLDDIDSFADDPDAAANSFCALLAGLPLPRAGACG